MTDSLSPVPACLPATGGTSTTGRPAWRGRLAWAFVAAAAGGWAVAPWPRALLERVYSRALYPHIARAFGLVADAVPFSVGGVALAVVAVILAARLVRTLRDGSRSFPARLVGVGWGAFRAALVVYLAFILVWGANYGREGVERVFDLSSGRPTSEEVAALVARLERRIAQEAEAALERDVPRAIAAARASMVDFLASRGLPAEFLRHRRVKETPPGLFLAFGTSGLFLPVVQEPHVDAALAEADLVGTAAHELAHAAGFASEADAELVGVVGAWNAKDPFTRYSVALHAYRRVVRALPTDARKRSLAALPEVARRDLEDAAARSRKHRVVVLDRMQKIWHDAFLRSQGVRSGMHDYSRAVGLLVRAARDATLLSD